MSNTCRSCAPLFVLLMISVDVAQAGLLRTSGRGTLSRNIEQGFYFVPNDPDLGFINEVGIVPELGEGGPDAAEAARFIDFRPTTEFFSVSSFRPVTGGRPGINAVPSECLAPYNQDEVDAAIADVAFQLEEEGLSADREGELLSQLDQLESGNPFPGEPCAWEFEQGEDLFTFGFFNPFDADGILYDVNWLISGDGLADPVVLPGSVNPASGTAPDGISTIDRGWVTLNTPPPDLSPGDYFISVAVSLSSDAGEFFWESDDPSDSVGLKLVCEDNPAYDAFFENPDNFDADDTLLPDLDVPSVNLCGFNSVDLISGEIRTAPTSFASDREIFRIVASPPPPPESTVATPSSLGLLLAGLLAFHRRRSARAASQR